MKDLTRRDFLRAAGISTGAALAPGFLSKTLVAAEPGRKPSLPNFVVILVDDMGYGDIEPFGSKLNRTPNLNRMAGEGLKLTSFYAAPVCTPSRAQMLTGCYAKRVSLPDVLVPVQGEGLNVSEKTVASMLKERGYATMCIGKWHLGDQPEFLPTRHGFDRYVGLPYSNDMGGNGGQPRDGKPSARPPLPLLRDEKVVEAPAEQDKLTELYTTEAEKFIAENKDRPFFIYLAHTAVHVPLHPGKQFQGKSANGKYGDWVEEVDWSVGRVLDTLRRLNLDSTTLVLFTSDNGPWLSKGKDGGVAGPLRGGKGSCWEGGVREPTVAWWPGRVPAGAVCDAVASEMDILPTLVTLAGGAAPTDRKIDGLDIGPLVLGKTRQSPHEALFYFNSRQLQAVRSGPWKLSLIKNGEPKPESQRKEEHGKFKPQLFNLDEDIGETKDVAAEHPDIVKRLLDFVEKMDKDLGVDHAGPGVRPCGKVANPKPLLMRAQHEYD